MITDEESSVRDWHPNIDRNLAHTRTGSGREPPTIIPDQARLWGFQGGMPPWRPSRGGCPLGVGGWANKVTTTTQSLTNSVTLTLYIKKSEANHDITLERG